MTRVKQKTGYENEILSIFLMLYKKFRLDQNVS